MSTDVIAVAEIRQCKPCQTIYPVHVISPQVPKQLSLESSGAEEKTYIASDEGRHCC
jgi:hypothetical protein